MPGATVERMIISGACTQATASSTMLVSQWPSSAIGVGTQMKTTSQRLIASLLLASSFLYGS